MVNYNIYKYSHKVYVSIFKLGTTSFYVHALLSFNLTIEPIHAISGGIIH
jgi:hypothetical protein